MARAEKVRRIFERFDVNGDGGLNRDEMASLVVAVNPRVKFSGEHISAILDGVFRTYSDFILPGSVGLSLDGLLRTYDDGAGDVDRDFDALAFSPLPSTPSPSLPSSASAPNSAFAFASAVVFNAVWQLLDDLDILIRRLRRFAHKNNSSSSSNFDSFSEAGWSRELGPAADRQISWDESSPHYAVFAREVAGLRARVDSAPSHDEAFDGHMAMGRALFHHRLFTESLNCFRRSYHLRPTDVRPHYHSGNALHALGHHLQAKYEFLLALEAAKASGDQWALLPQIHVNLGIIMEGEGMALSACEHYQQAVVLCPTHFSALKLLGSVLLAIGEYPAAKMALEEAVFLRPDYADAHCDLGLVLHTMGDEERAIREFQKAINLKPGHLDALYNLGGLFMDAGQFVRASEIYARVLRVRPNHWRAQLNKAVALLGVGDVEDAKEAFKEAFKMTNRIEVHDAIAHLKLLKKKKKNKNESNGQDGDTGFLVVEASKFKCAGNMTTLRQDLASALEIRAFQRLTRLSRCDVDVLRKEMKETDVPVSSSESGVPEKCVRKAALEVILRKILSFLKAQTFLGAVKAINERVLSVLDTSGSACVDLGMFFAVLAPICSGPTDKRKRFAFDALLWRANNENASEIRRTDAVAYIKLLRAIYIRSYGVSDMMEMMEVHGESDQSVISYAEFLEMFNDSEQGFVILDTLVKIESGERIRHKRHYCSTCQYPITGSIFKETKLRFNLCNRCYSEGKVPSIFKQEEYRFKEYGSEAEAMKDKCSCFTLQPIALNVNLS